MSRGWAIVAALSVTETVSWGVLYYVFAVVLLPMQRELGFSAAELTGAFSLGVLVAGIAGIGVGRFLDRRGPRVLMTAGSLAGALLVVAWSRVEGLAAFYALWVALGVVMATVLYEPAFTVLAKWFADADERRRAMTALTLVAGVSSFIFLPLGQALIDAHGWRSALVILAVVLAVVTVPLHALVLRQGPASVQPAGDAGDVLRSAPFWLLSAGFFLASLAAFAMIVQAIPFLLDRGHGTSFAAFAVGLMGASQIPGRFVFALAAARLPSGLVIPSVFALVALGIVLIVAVPGHDRRAGGDGRARDGQRDGDPGPRHGHRRPLRVGGLRRDRGRCGVGHDGSAGGGAGRRRGVGVGRRLRGAALDARRARRPRRGARRAGRARLQRVRSSTRRRTRASISSRMRRTPSRSACAGSSSSQSS